MMDVKYVLWTFFFLLTIVITIGFDLQGTSLLVVSLLANNDTVLRTKTLGTNLAVQQTNVNLQGEFTLFKLNSPQHLRRVQLTDSGDFADLRDNGELIISLADATFQQFHLSDESCPDAVELYTPIGLSDSIVLLITCTGGRVLCAKYSNGMYTIDSIFASAFKASTPVIVTADGISTAIYTVEDGGVYALVHRSLEPNGFENSQYVETFYDTFESCTKTLSYNETHVRLSCPNTNNFYIVDGLGNNGGKIYPTGVGDLVNLYNQDAVLVVGISSVTINTKESTNLCALDLPNPVARVDYVRTNGALKVLFFSSQGLYQYDTSTSCSNVNLVTLINVPLPGIGGDFQNYLLFKDLLVYTVMNNGLYSSHGINLSTSENLGVFANHQNHPLLYGLVTNDDSAVTMTTSTFSTATISERTTAILSTSISTSIPSTKTSSVVTTTTSSSINVVTTLSSVYSFVGIKTSSSTSSTTPFSTTATTTMENPSGTDSEAEPLKFMDILPFLLSGIIVVLVIIASIAIPLWCCHCVKKKRPSSEDTQLTHMQSLSSTTSSGSNPDLQTNYSGSNGYETEAHQAQQTSSSALTVNRTDELKTDQTTTLSSHLSMPIPYSKEEQDDRHNESVDQVIQKGQFDILNDKNDSLV